MKMNKIFIGLSIAVGVLTSCKNQDISFSDFDYQTVYFANQYPARTIELGDDLFVDNTIDNQHKVLIKATTGGVYDNKNNIVIDFKVDESYCNGIYFKSGGTTGSKLLPMPSNYYQLASNQISIPSGSLMGGVEVTLTDAFFADPKSLVNTYAIPLVMTKVQGADSILQGKPAIDNANPCVDANWTIKPQNFVLYVVKYVNPWHGNYLRRGGDHITKTSDGSVVNDSVRHNQYLEYNELVKISTTSLSTVTLPLSIKRGAQKVSFNLVLTFASDGTCTVSGDNPTSFDISGTGKFVSKGEKNSIGGIDRDGLYLDYSVNLKNYGLKYATKDTMVVRDRAVGPEYYTVEKK
ncbi:MAG: DUF5627 domain-containing protein [Bacteroidota bacterium]|nr:DUF5627 domain-containing protein [Bacteroidota bacterium]